MRKRILGRVTSIALVAVLASVGPAQSEQAAKVPANSAKNTANNEAAPFEPGLQPKAVEILKAASARLAAAGSMAFTAVVSYEGPSLLGPPLIYSTKSEVALQRPDKLRVLTLGDGPATEFYYDGKLMMAFAPAENLLAVADAPSSIDATLATAYQTAAIYFPFTDLIVADPYKDMADGLTTAFYIGQSKVVGGTTTDMVAMASKDVFIQIWIGAEDKLPRRLYAIYLNDPARLRHVLELSNWELQKQISPDAFHSAKADKAVHIAFRRPDENTTASAKPATAQPSHTP
jgi:hypothetical protein